MINIITGPINSGKTTKIKEIYKKHSTGDGFVSIKRMTGKKVEGFDLVKLSTGEKKAFVRRTGEEPADWKENCRLGPYTFSDEAVCWAADEVSEFIRKGTAPVFLDEVGELEINGECFFKTVLLMVNNGGEIYISVRDESLDKVIDRFSIADAAVIRTGERYA